MKTIFTLTLIQISLDGSKVEKARTVGWFSNLDQAIKALRKVPEIGANYAIIEKVLEGVLPVPKVAEVLAKDQGKWRAASLNNILRKFTNFCSLG